MTPLHRGGPREVGKIRRHRLEKTVPERFLDLAPLTVAQGF